ncbi:MAG: D-alanyl-D-alanine carboxypeptidase, partial [Evtepia sp.]|nr:D-alanyl-D-alanine carboxypeptidase [Evtepia sp.]
DSQLLLAKADAAKVSTTIDLADTLQAPVEQGQELGNLTVLVDGKETQTLPLVAQEGVPRLTLWQVYRGMLETLFCGV